MDPPMCWFLDGLQAECVESGGEMLKLKTCALLFGIIHMLQLFLFGKPFLHACKGKQQSFDTGLFPCHVFLCVGLQVSKKMDYYLFYNGIEKNEISFRTFNFYLFPHVVKHVVFKLL